MIRLIKRIILYTCLLTPLSAVADIQNGLLDYWSFDGKDINWNTNTIVDKKNGDNNLLMITMSTSTAPSPGAIGQSLRFDGVNDYADGTGYTMTVFSVSAWIRTSQIITNFEGLVDWSDSSQRRFGIGLDQSGDPVLIYVNASDQNRRREAAGVNVDDMKWHHLVGIFDGSNTYMYVDGKEVTLGGEINDLSSATNASDLRIGQHTAGSFFYPGEIDEVRIYSRALSSDDVYQLYRLGESKISSSVSNPFTSNLISWWTLDGKDTNWATNTTVDRSGNGNIGTLTSMSTTTSPVSGKAGQALYFDGVDDVVTAGDINAIDGVTNLTISAWMKRNRAGSFVTLGKSEASARRLNINMFNDGNIYINIGNCTSATYGYFASNDTNWHHIVVVFDGSQSTNATRLVVYMDGVPRTLTFFGTIPNTTCGASSDVFSIGRDTSQSNFSNGFIDDVRIYSKSFTASEVSSLYKSGQSLNAVSKNISSSDPLSNGLVGHWTFDGKNMNWGLNIATDVSNNSNQGFLVNMSTTSSPTPGKIGQALFFDGFNDYIGVTNSTSLNINNEITLAAWFRLNNWPPTGLQYIVGKGYDGTTEGYYIRFSNSSLQAGSYSIPTDYSASWSIDSRIQKNRWHHVVAKYDGSYWYLYVDGALVRQTVAANGAFQNNKQIVLGGADINGVMSRFINGSIDDVRIYNRSLSDNEITNLLNLGISKRR